MKFPTATATIFSAFATTMTFAFTPTTSFTQQHSISSYSSLPKIQQVQTRNQPNARSNSRIRLVPDPSSAIETSSIVTSDLVEGIASTIGSLLLLGSVGFGVYAGVMEEGAEKSMDEGTADDMVPVEMSAKPVLEEVEEKVEEVTEKAEEIKEEAEEITTDVDEVIEEDFVEPVIAATATVAATSEKVLKDTEKAIKEVQKKGVAETKEKMSSKTATPPSEPAPAAPVEEVSKAVVEETTDSNKAVGKKRKIVKGVALIVAAAGVVAVRKLVQAWVGRGMI